MELNEMKDENRQPEFVVDRDDHPVARTTFAVIFAIGFLAILGIGGTFAYLTWTGNQTPNRMTTNPEITADLLEPAWTNAVVSQVGSNSSGTASDGEYIPTAADGMTPGSVVEKNPFVVNTSRSGLEEFVGIRLLFQKWTVKNSGDTQGDWKTMTYDEVKQILKVYAISTSNDKTQEPGMHIDSTNWTELNYDNKFTYLVNTGNICYYYNNAISALSSNAVESEDANSNTWGYTVPTTYAKGDTATTCLFNYIVFSERASNSDIQEMVKMLKGDAAPADPGWRIVVNCAAIQSTDGKTAADFADTSAGLVFDWRILFFNNNLHPRSMVASGVREGKTTGSYTKANTNLETNPTAGITNTGLPEATNSYNLNQ